MPLRDIITRLGGRFPNVDGVPMSVAENTKGVAPPKDRTEPYSGYFLRDLPEPDTELAHIGAGTRMGEFMRRFWQPVCLADQLTDLPLAIRVLGEDLVAFRDKTGNVGVLHRHCSHRGTSLEYGIVSEKGLRCCYHGWLFDVDGTVIETPGEPPGSKLRDSLRHGAYPAFEYKGLVFAYLGPPQEKTGVSGLRHLRAAGQSPGALRSLVSMQLASGPRQRHGSRPRCHPS